MTRLQPIRRLPIISSTLVITSSDMLTLGYTLDTKCKYLNRFVFTELPKRIYDH